MCLFFFFVFSFCRFFFLFCCYFFFLSCIFVYFFFFFFQAEDGIRDTSVTGVQTCALPICPAPPTGGAGTSDDDSVTVVTPLSWRRPRIPHLSGPRRPLPAGAPPIHD